MYNQKNARVKVNGTLSEIFNLKRRTRQGDPLLPHIFALRMESLAESNRKNKIITGIKIGEEEHKLALYADDMIVFLTNFNKPLPFLMEEIGKYSSLSGYKLNIHKTEAMTIGQQIEKEVKRKYNFKWECNKLRYLGIMIPKNLEEFSLGKLNRRQLDL